MTILLVEDNEIRAGELKRTLSEHEVTHVTSSRVALEALSSSSFEAVFLDMDLDDGIGAGLKVAEWLGRSNTRPRIVIHSMNTGIAAKAKRLVANVRVIPMVRFWKAREEGELERLLEEALG